MSVPSTETQETETSTTPRIGQKGGIRLLLRRAKLGLRLVKGWIFRGGSRKRLTHSVGKRDSCEMRKLCGGHAKNKDGR